MLFQDGHDVIEVFLDPIAIGEDLQTSVAVLTFIEAAAILIDGSHLFVKDFKVSLIVPDRRPILFIDLVFLISFVNLGGSLLDGNTLLGLGLLGLDSGP